MISFHIQILGMCDKSLPNSLGDLRVGIVSDPAIQYYHDTWVTNHNTIQYYKLQYAKYCELFYLVPASLVHHETFFPNDRRKNL